MTRSASCSWASTSGGVLGQHHDHWRNCTLENVTLCLLRCRSLAWRTASAYIRGTTADGRTAGHTTTADWSWTVPCCWNRHAAHEQSMVDKSTPLNRADDACGADLRSADQHRLRLNRAAHRGTGSGRLCIIGEIPLTCGSWTPTRRELQHLQSTQGIARVQLRYTSDDGINPDPSIRADRQTQQPSS